MPSCCVLEQFYINTIQPGYQHENSYLNIIVRIVRDKNSSRVDRNNQNAFMVKLKNLRKTNPKVFINLLLNRNVTNSTNQTGRQDRAGPGRGITVFVLTNTNTYVRRSAFVLVPTREYATAKSPHADVREVNQSPAGR